MTYSISGQNVSQSMWMFEILLKRGLYDPIRPKNVEHYTQFLLKKGNIILKERISNVSK